MDNQLLGTGPIALPALSKVQRTFMVGSLLVALGLAILFYFHSLTFPPCCDALHYVAMARFFETYGVVANAPHADVRTFGYPWFVSLVSRVAGPLGIPLLVAVFLTQIALYFGLAALLYRRFSRAYGPAAGSAVFCGLTLNVLLLPYLPLTLTDGFSIILMLAATWVLLGISAEDRWGLLAFRAVTLGLIVGFAVVVRPANLWFGSLLFIGALLVYRKRAAGGARRPRLRVHLGVLVFVAIAALASVVATLPQTALNWARARQATPFPIYDIKGLQVDLGIRNIKYATNMVGGAKGLHYRNPLVPEAKGRYGFQWYFQEPLRAVGTVALRMFGGFDFDYLFPYIYDLRPSYRPVLFAISQFIVFFGLGGALLLASPTLSRRVLSERAAARLRWNGPIPAAAVFIPAFLGWGAIYGVTGIENRFALPMVTLLMPVAVAALWAVVSVFRSGLIKRGLWIMAGFLAWIMLAIPLAVVLEQSKQLPAL